MSSLSAFKGSFFIFPAEAPHSKLSIMHSIATLRAGLKSLNTIPKDKLPRESLFSRNMVLGISPTSLTGKSTTQFKARAIISPASDDGTFAFHFLGQNIMIAITNTPMRTAYMFGENPSLP
ncbi:hypothetical protein SDC9_74403 [bioreactor metagenome]|uniref:Uncharacterized protein n=1 Tax=bioreactor metagenome TaxID=1076179 RepID=A0A644YIQ2_9ZZZZ